MGYYYSSIFTTLREKETKVFYSKKELLTGNISTDKRESIQRFLIVTEELQDLLQTRVSSPNSAI